MVAESSCMIHFIFSSVISIQITSARQFPFQGAQARNVYFSFPKSLTNIPLRTLGSAQSILLSLHFCKAPSQALTFFYEKKPHFLCKIMSPQSIHFQCPKFRLTNLASPLHFTSFSYYPLTLLSSSLYHFSIPVYY